ncbi:AraC family transcriptional regulator [Asaia bogorensis]|uniref:AraC family transcriptional regulator n=1 Tax=Asaia bogorensis TaxID=91915 RepID=UPI000EFDA461|nr:AraC family transcriptional regulator [Asaia bogorensis]
MGITAPLLIDRIGREADLFLDRDRDRTESIALHRHPHGELGLIRRGHIVTATEQARWMIPAGQAYWVPPYMAHGGDMAGVDGCRLYISASLAQELMPSEPAALTATPLMEALMSRWERDLQAPCPVRPIDHHLLAVMRDEIETNLASPVLLPMPRHALTRAVLSDWARHCEEKLSLDDLASKCGLSRRSFTRRFHAETGLSPGAWMQIARIIRGCQLLAAGLPVTEIALMLGYESVTSFVTLCRAHTGFNPTTLRQKI